MLTKSFLALVPWSSLVPLVPLVTLVTLVPLVLPSSE